MKKFIYNILLVMIMGAVGTSLTCCGNDDDNNDESVTEISSLWGTWYDYHGGSYQMYTFNKNNKGVGVEHYDGEEDDTWNFTYQFDETTGKLSMAYDDDDEVEVLKVVFKNSETIYVYDYYDPDNGYSIYTRGK